MQTRNGRVSGMRGTRSQQGMRMRLRAKEIETLESRWALAVAPLAVEGATYGSPQISQLVSISEQIQAATFADLNQDGRLDLIYSIYDSKSLQIRLGSQDGSYGAPTSVAVNTTATQITSGDLNNDGMFDLVIGSDTQFVVLLSQRGPGGTWLGLQQSQNLSGLTTGLALGDVNGDGSLDLIVGRQDRVDVRLGHGNGQFGAATRYTTESGDRRVALADLDGDEDLDLVIGTALAGGFNGQITVLENDGEGVFEAESAKFPLGHGPLTIKLADLNDDGHIDLVIGHVEQENGNLSVWNGLGDRTFAATPRRHEILGAPEVLQFADINGDERLDIVAGHRGTFHHPINGNGPGGVSVILSNEAGFGEAIRLSTPEVKAIQIGDINGDGRQDIVTVDYQDVTTHFGRAADTFSSAATLYRSSDRGTSLAASGDLNADGWNDLVYFRRDFAPESVGELQVMYGAADDQWVLGPILTMNRLATELHVGNLDGDAAAEVVLMATQDFTAFELQTLELNAAGQWSTMNVTAMQGMWNTHFTFDADNNGQMDLMGLDPESGSARVLISRGDGTFRGGPTLPDSSTWSYPKTAFIDGDAIPDFLTSSSQGSFVYLGNGDGTFRETYRNSRTFTDMNVGDFDGDGLLDFADTQFDSTQIRIHYGDGTGKFPRTEDLETGQQYFTVRGLDVQGDGLTDLLIDHPNGFRLARNSSAGFGPFELYAVPFYAGTFQSVDPDGDGIADLIVAAGPGFSANQSQLAVFPGQANGQLGDAVIYSFPSYSVDDPLPILQQESQRAHVVLPTMNGFLLVNPQTATLPGDVNEDGQVTLPDLDLLCAAVVSGQSDGKYDLNRDSQVSAADVDYFLAQIVKTTPGDVNLDGVFNSSDLVALFQIGEYEDQIASNSRWSEGDFDCDGDFTTGDLVLAFQLGIYSTQ